MAGRMRDTLIEVLGVERGTTMYTLEWLEERVRWHLRPAECDGAVLVAESPELGIVGHTIVRVDADELGVPLGLFSTTFVVPIARRSGVADALLSAGEAWLIGRGMTRLATYTATDNLPLHRLYERRGYRVVLRSDDGEMVRLERGPEGMVAS